MESIRESMHACSADLIDKICDHPFLAQLADGTLPEERVRRWIAQDYLWLREFERFLAVLASRAPLEVRRSFFESLLNFHAEIELLEEMSAQMRIDLAGARPTFICHAYTCFLHAAVRLCPFEESLAVCYAAAYSFRRAWARVAEIQSGSSRWKPLIDHWNGEGFGEYLETLASHVDAVSARCPFQSIERMKEVFRNTLCYELRFWDMALGGPDW